MTWYEVLAQAADPPWLTLVNFGALGLIVILLVTGQLYAKPWVDRLLHGAEERVAAEAKRADAAEAKAAECSEHLDRLNAVFRDQVVPALVRSTDIQARMVDRSARGMGGSDG